MYFSGFALFLLFLVLTTAREYLEEGRRLYWATDDLNYGPYRGQPEQVHLALGDNVGSMTVTWLTFDDVGLSVVEYGLGFPINRKISAKTNMFKDGGKLHTARYIHRATIQGIKPGRRYYYRVGSEHGWSSIFTFVGLKERPEGGYRYAIYGDLGNINARSLGKIQRLVQDGELDMIIHNGDFAYDMDNKDGKVGDEFMRQIEPAAAYVPYMTSVGNHEQAWNFTHYINRFTMPGNEHGLFYSFDLGFVHFISISAEFYFYLEYGSDQLMTQMNWLREDLERATANRARVPWIIMFAHRAMYCTNIFALGCKDKGFVFRDGFPDNGSYAMEEILNKYGVDMFIGGHEHVYERFWPLYKFKVRNGSTEEPYTDPAAPVHITTGSAGCKEVFPGFPKHPSAYSAFRSSKYGFGVIQAYNHTHLYFEQILAGWDRVDDNFWLIKNKHEPYPSPPIDDNPHSISYNTDK